MMKKVTINIDEITQKISKTHLSTLENASQISPYITERTLGPDLEPWDSKLPMKMKDFNENFNLNSKPEGNEYEFERRNVGRAKSEPPKTPEKLAPIKVKMPKSSESLKGNSYLNNVSFNLTIIDPKLLNETILLNDSETKRLKTIKKESFEKQKVELTRTLENAKANRSMIKDEFEQRQLRLTMVRKEIERQTELCVIRNSEIEKKHIEENRKQIEKRIQGLVLQGISMYQGKFRAKYEIVAKLLMAHNKDPGNNLVQELNKKLRDLILSFENLINDVRKGMVTSKEMASAEKLCANIELLERLLIKDLNLQTKQALDKAAELPKQQELLQQKQKNLEIQRIRQQKAIEQQEQLQQQQTQPQELQPQFAQQAKQSEQMVSTNSSQVVATQNTSSSNQTVTDSGSSAAPATKPSKTLNDRFYFYETVMIFFKQKLDRIKPFQTDEPFTKYRNTCQRIVNTPINAISNINGDFLRDKYDKIIKFFGGNPQKTSLGDITINDHPLARDFCNILMAKTFVGKGYLEISSNPLMAFSVASVIVSIWKLYPEFGTLYLAHTFKESPLLAPIFIPKQSYQSDQEYLHMLGYHIDKNGKLEDEPVFLKRQGGIARLYAAVMITNGRQSDHHVPHPYGIEQAWLWLVNFLSLTPIPSLSANTLLEMLQIISSDLIAVYGKQFIKLLVYIQQYYMPKLNNIDQGGPKVRLEMLLETFLKEGVIQKPKGIMPPDFW